MSKLEILSQRQEAIQAEMQTIETASAERNMTADEVETVTTLAAEFDANGTQIETLSRMAQVTSISHQSLGRQTQPDDVVVQTVGNPSSNVRIERLPGALDAMGGYMHAGEYFLDVAAASVPNGHISDKLARLQPTNYSNTGTPAEGGYAVPPDFREFIWQAIMGESTLMGRTDQYFTAFNTVTVPKDELGPWSSSGPQANWVAEAAQKPDSKVALTQQQVALHKLAALLPVTDQLLEDSPMMNSYIQTKVPEVLNFECDNVILNGTGTGQPTGIIGHASSVVVPRTANNIVEFDDITNLWTRVPPQWRSRAIWFGNPDHEANLWKMAFDPAASSKFPIMMPGMNASQGPFTTIGGRPFVGHEAAPAPNAAGDFGIFVPTSYFTALKTGGGIRQDVSIHLYFDYDITTYRFVIRQGGEPWLSAPIARAGGNSNTWTGSAYLGAGS